MVSPGPVASNSQDTQARADLYRPLHSPVVILATLGLAVITAVVQPSLGRPLSGGAANVTVNLIEPGTLFTPQTNLVDLRFSKILKFYGKFRTSLNLDVYNVGNSSGITSVSSNLSNLLTPQGIHLARFYKFSANFDF